MSESRKKHVHETVKEHLRQLGQRINPVAESLDRFRTAVNKARTHLELAKKKKQWIGEMKKAIVQLHEAANVLRKTNFRDKQQGWLCPELVREIDDKAKKIGHELRSGKRDKQVKELAALLDDCFKQTMCGRTFRNHVEKSGSLEKVQEDFEKLGLPPLAASGRERDVEFTEKVFNPRYCAVYCDYSDKLPWYDEPAHDAAVIAKYLLPNEKRCRKFAMDFGCGFGTAAYHAAMTGFERVLCVDRSRSFRQLFDLLWSVNDDWEAELDEYLSNDIIKVASSYLGKPEAESRRDFAALFRRKHEEFKAASGVCRNALDVNYWRLDSELKNCEFANAEFNCLLLHNSFHWILLNRALELEFEGKLPKEATLELLRSKNLDYTLERLTRHLAADGVIVFLEPSCFWHGFSGTEGNSHRIFNGRRFEEQACSKATRKLINKLILESESLLATPDNHAESQTYEPVRFRLKDFERAAVKCGCEFGFLRIQYEAKKQMWPSQFLGDTMMVTAQSYELNRYADETALSALYRKIHRLLRDRKDTFDVPLIDCEYFILIGTKGLKAKLQELEPSNLDLRGTLFVGGTD